MKEEDQLINPILTEDYRTKEIKLRNQKNQKNQKNQQTMAKRFKITKGDIFTIPITSDETGFGQLVELPDKYTLIIIVFNYKALTTDIFDVGNIIKKDILFLGYTNDAKLYHKDWEIIGNRTDNLMNVSMPCFKLGLPNDDYPDGARLVNYKGDVIANINKSQFDKLSFETEVGPIRFEKALRAHFGLEEWIPDNYDKILYEKTLESVKIAEEILES
ncbi:immunity 26/phosphotriesterase HocA family protein [Chryseobacterium sp. MEBOG06]|uniref:Imm26 family immunity protein n=1 Tax=Chryseobacterium sp. MEBOG06 TaxID=2879938 RepID=UPI001F2114D1|nr:Imm26 family immunity protein [Chryseobacterium sp. MEBOG06]UKB82733.1 immunity 26/phosphotriesterase HocA family protein [Chryseobacterium sp. MEBOG06]